MRRGLCPHIDYRRLRWCPECALQSEAFERPAIDFDEPQFEPIAIEEADGSSKRPFRLVSLVCHWYANSAGGFRARGHGISDPLRQTGAATACRDDLEASRRSRLPDANIVRTWNLKTRTVQNLHRGPLKCRRFENSLKYLKPRLCFRCSQEIFEPKPKALDKVACLALRRSDPRASLSPRSQEGGIGPGTSTRCLSRSANVIEPLGRGRNLFVSIDPDSSVQPKAERTL
jgi:hypothetical protein